MSCSGVSYLLPKTLQFTISHNWRYIPRENEAETSAYRSRTELERLGLSLQQCCAVRFIGVSFEKAGVRRVIFDTGSRYAATSGARKKSRHFPRKSEGHLSQRETNGHRSRTCESSTCASSTRARPTDRSFPAPVIAMVQGSVWGGPVISSWPATWLSHTTPYCSGAAR
jgi:hypothetical protein